MKTRAWPRGNRIEWFLIAFRKSVPLPKVREAAVLPGGFPQSCCVRRYRKRCCFAAITLAEERCHCGRSPPDNYLSDVSREWGFGELLVSRRRLGGGAAVERREKRGSQESRSEWNERCATSEGPVHIALSMFVRLNTAPATGRPAHYLFIESFCLRL